MPNRYLRDELIKISIDQSQVAQLKQHDCPNGVVQPDAFSIQWLQDIIDFWYHMRPFGAGVDDIPLNIPSHTTAIPLPSNFILDVRNGYVRQTTESPYSMGRMIRLPLQKWLNRDLMCQGQLSATSNSVPNFYMVQGSTIKVTPQSSIDRNARLWYYFLPPALNSNDKPLFPNDYVIIEYLKIRALEWCRVYEPGTAQKFCDKIVGGMKAAGLLNEPEDDEIPFDTLTYKSGYGRNTPYSWMGPV